MTDIRILVTGSRDWEDENAICEAMASENLCWEHSDCDHRYILVSGACPTGADAIAEKIADQMGYVIERYPADWEEHGKRAGFVRNSEMVALGADVCLAFIMPCSSPKCGRREAHGSHGATMTADLAEKADIRTMRIEVSE